VNITCIFNIVVSMVIYLGKNYLLSQYIYNLSLDSIQELILISILFIFKAELINYSKRILETKYLMIVYPTSISIMKDLYFTKLLIPYYLIVNKSYQKL